MTTQQIDRLKECESAIEQLKHLQKYLAGLADSITLGIGVVITNFGHKETRHQMDEHDHRGTFVGVHTDDWRSINETIEARLVFWQKEIEKV